MKIKQQKLRKQIVSFICIIIISFSIIFLLVYYLSNNYENKKNDILKNPIFHNGIITRKNVYKIQSFDIRYFVNNKSYNFSAPVKDSTFLKYKTGDEIEIIYNKLNFEHAILKIQSEKKDL